VVEVRDAMPADARALAALAERTFRDTFGEANSEADMDAHCAANFGEALQQAEIGDPDWTTLVAEDAGSLVGYGQLRWSPAPACVAGSRPIEIYRLYVDGRWHGRGVAAMLMDALLQQAIAMRADTVWLGVWERNPRAIAYYRKSGFHEKGEHRFMLGSDPQRDIVMSRRLTV
jgi:ribosomal protein S18 acetylase RimI-like enzyme